jgi:tRNA (adenine57-N1/adenine58-N1)-methyltransferase
LPSMFIEEGMDILLYLDDKRNYLTRVVRGERFHTHRGFIQMEEVIGKTFGQPVKTNLGHRFYILEPTVYDYLMKSSRATQILYPKDIGLILVFSAIRLGSRVVEAGTGSGALTTALANIVRPTGRVYSYDLRREFQKKASNNLQRAGLAEFVELKEGDITHKIEEKDVDAVILDLATPWKVVPVAQTALRGSGILVSFSPTIEQTIKTVSAMEECGYVDIETVECLLRRIKVKAGETRPETLMVGHTGYITRSRKTEA